MNPTVFTIVFFGCLLLGTLMLQGMSGLSIREQSSPMGVTPLILGIIITILTIFIINNYPFGPGTEHINNISEKDDLKAWGIAYGMFLIALLLFFMKLNSTDQKYSLASGVGTFGILRGLATLVILWMLDDKIIKPSPINSYYYEQISLICYSLHKFILVAAAGILCGAVFTSGNMVRNSCIILIACYLLSSNIVTNSLPCLMCDTKNADTWDEYKDDLEKAAESIRYLQYTPFVGWIILMVSFYLQPEKKESNQ
jgi:hypothetical protein